MIRVLALQTNDEQTSMTHADHCRSICRQRRLQIAISTAKFHKSERKHGKASNVRLHSRHSWDSTKTTAAHAWLAFHSLWLRILTGLRRKFGKALLYFCHVEDFNSFQFCICPYNKADPAQQNLCSPFPTESMSCACWRPQVGRLLVSGVLM